MMSGRNDTVIGKCEDFGSVSVGHPPKSSTRSIYKFQCTSLLLRQETDIVSRFHHARTLYSIGRCFDILREGHGFLFLCFSVPFGSGRPLRKHSRATSCLVHGITELRKIFHLLSLKVILRHLTRSLPLFCVKVAIIIYMYQS